MQCLFCGKELALLKRLTGGGEFCSEAHRKEYQEQYEQLALARLIQAKPRAEAPAPLDRPSFTLPVSADLGESLYAEGPPASIATLEAPASVTVTPAARMPVEETGPAPLAGFLRESMVPAVTPFEHAGAHESQNVSGVTTLLSLPGLSSTDSAASEPAGSQGYPPPAPRVALEISLQALDHHTRKNERGMELRDFPSAAPIMELNLRPDSGNEPAGAADVMEILMLPHPPQKAKPWLGVPRGFLAAPAELGDLARLDFATTGFGQPESFAYSDGPAAAGPVQTTSAPQAEPVPEVTLAPEPAIPVKPAKPEQIIPEQIVPEQIVPEQIVPALVTEVLPVTLHGVAAPYGKLAQPFASAIIAATDVQTPASTALPLRPVIVFGPAPVPNPGRAPEAASPPVQSRPVQATPAQTKPEERFRTPVVPAPKPVSVKRTVPSEAALQEKTQEKAVPKVSAPAAPPPRVDPRKEWSATQSPEMASRSSDGPSLHLDATETGWSRLSSGLKIGVAAALIVGLSGVAYLVTRGGKTVPEPPVTAPVTASVVSGVPISGGWIDDWGNAARTNRHISMLSGSVKLSDYRLEFQSQIETKAIGWVFRGLNARNYYVAKLEITKPGLEPTVALVHFAVVDGQDESRVAVPLPMKLRVDTNYKIRFDVVGNRFTTWVQDQKISEWTDSRFGSGGVGFFAERDEKAALQGTVNVVALVPKN